MIQQKLFVLLLAHFGSESLYFLSHKMLFLRWNLIYYLDNSYNRTLYIFCYECLQYHAMTGIMLFTKVQHTSNGCIVGCTQNEQFCVRCKGHVVSFANTGNGNLWSKTLTK